MTGGNSAYGNFRRDDYLSISNRDLDVLMESYKKYDNEPHIERVNISILEMIQAYDIDHKRTDLLDTAQSLSKWLSDKYSENSVYVLNYLQCMKRRRDFINDEIKALNNISNQNPDNITIQFAVQVLLENYRSTSAYLDDMKEESRESIILMPIYNLLKDILDTA